MGHGQPSALAEIRNVLIVARNRVYFMAWYDFSIVDNIVFFRAMGLVGFTLYVCGFLCLCTGRLTSSTPAYFLLVFCASSCVLVSLVADFNLSAALIQSFYIVMSLGGAALRWRQYRTAHR